MQSFLFLNLPVTLNSFESESLTLNLILYLESGGTVKTVLIPRICPRPIVSSIGSPTRLPSTQILTIIVIPTVESLLSTLIA